MGHSSVFPFCAVLGQDMMKTALLLNVINPNIGGVLISGEKGTAKSTLVRGLAALIEDVEVVDLPLNVTEDRLIGTIDLEKAIKEGKRSFEPGVLFRADGNLLYVDEVNLLSDYIVNCLLEVSTSHVNRVEREGISCSHPSRFVLVGTMNPEEGALRPQFLDRFGLYVEARGSDAIRERKEIIHRRLEYENDRGKYLEMWREETEKLAAKIAVARRVLALVKTSENAMKLAAQFAIEGHCAGNRAEIAVIETARAIAAWDNRTTITVEDMKQAAELALPHRVRPMQEQELERQGDDFRDNMQNHDRNEPQDHTQENNAPTSEAAFDENDGHNENNKANTQDSPLLPQFADQEKIEEPGEMFKVKPIEIKPPDKKKRRGSGKRSQTATHALQGRYIRYTFPRGRIKDIAFDATLRAAAPYQNSREKAGLAVSIKNSDLREKIREKRTGSTILFVVDSSGSMGAKQRMKAVKGAILSLLNDAYQKRDKVGMIAFRKDAAQLLLGITRSVDLAQKKLIDLPTGGKTPLAEGLCKGYELIQSARMKDPDIVPFMVLITDGRANASVHGGNPVHEALELAGKIASQGIRALVIDTENSYITLGLASKIAHAMKADYYKLDELRKTDIAFIVRGSV